MKSPILVVLALGRAGCVTDDELRAHNLARHNQNCAYFGFAHRSPATAQCISTASANRAADQDRWAQLWMQQQALHAHKDRGQAPQDHRNRQIADQETQDFYNRVQAAMGQPQAEIAVIKPIKITPRDFDPLSSAVRTTPSRRPPRKYRA